MSDPFRGLANPVDPTPLVRKVAPMTDRDAELLRKYKRFLQTHGLRESLWCRPCEDAGRAPGLRATVTDAKIDFECRCTVRRYRGQNY